MPADQRLRQTSGRTVLVVTAAAMAVYLVMLLVTLPHLTALSGGLRVFDMRPTGYDRAQATALLTALGAEGRHYYLTRQLALDLFYPALYAASFWLIAHWLAGRMAGWGAWFRGLGVLPLLAAGADFAENALVMRLLLAFPEVPAATVRAASVATLLKSGLTTAFFLGLFGLLAMVGARTVIPHRAAK